MELKELKELMRQAVPKGATYASLRLHRDRDEVLAVRQGVLLPPSLSDDVGAMVQVVYGGGVGYAATSAVDRAGLTQAFAEALAWAKVSAQAPVTDFAKVARPTPKGQFTSPVGRPWESMPLSAKVELLRDLCQRLKLGSAIVDWEASLWRSRSERIFLTDAGGEVVQDFDRLTPMLRVVANDGQDTVRRSFGGMAMCRQQGLELLGESGFLEAPHSIAEEALALLKAPNCPSGSLDLLLAPDQMVLQIHESIGHPLELDRILGDERNYAGTSFVTMDMFGSYRYGSDLLNVTYDPTRPEQTASFAFDDEGLAAERQHIIKDGILLRPLGGHLSAARAKELTGRDLGAVANCRADSWRRPPIDRMANLNVEPGTSSFKDMVAGVERGVFMRTNCSWSIDDSRNKFQFGCEWAQLIENGELTKVVKKPNYRGISASFWRSLKAVGDGQGFEVLGTPYCGKGEPNQAIFVGHASPVCLFGNVDVFGGE